METRYTVTRYRQTRFWAVWHGSNLIAVVVYRKGAQEIIRRLSGS